MPFQRNRKYLSTIAVLGGLVATGWGGLVTGCGETGVASSVESRTQQLTVRAECLGDAGTEAGHVWTCGEERVVECRTRTEAEAVEVLHVDAEGCAPADLSVNPGPYGVGTHEISVFTGDAGMTSVEAGPDADSGSNANADGGSGATPVCTARLTIRDTAPPLAETREQELWPPNHELQQITIEECVTLTDECDADLDVQFTSARADEAEDENGSGQSAPDIVFDDCRTVSLRAERAGSGDGRVYELGWKATDDAGNSVQGICHVVVPHDRGRGRNAEDAGAGGHAAQRVEAPQCQP